MNAKSAFPKQIALYLPQFHPIPENDNWWGKGFTEWTNVGKARPLYPGHYQPHIPADIGYYDLRVPETREAQASLAAQYGVDGFCYWHYWFGDGKRLLEMPIEEVISTQTPDFPFCLGWANHSWEAKNWSTQKSKNKVLIEQRYPGSEDCEAHFRCVLRAFKDSRYIRIENKPVFLIWDPLAIPNTSEYLETWKNLAKKEGIPDIYFIGFTFFSKNVSAIYQSGFDRVLYDALFEARNSDGPLLLTAKKIIRELFGLPIRLPYSKYTSVLLRKVVTHGLLPCILPNYDHTPRSGKRGVVLESSPRQFEKLLRSIYKLIVNGTLDVPIIFIKSWNEWGEGNHLEPDLKYGHRFLLALKSATHEELRKQKNNFGSW